MGKYLALPVINDLIQQVKETPDNRNAIHAMLAAILNNYYPAQNGFAVSFGTHRNNTRVDAVVFRIQSNFPGDQDRDRRLVEHMYVKIGRPTDPIASLRDELQNALQGLGSEVERPWAIIDQGCTFYFYCCPRAKDGRCWLVEWGLPAEGPPRNWFDVRDRALEIGWVLQYIAEAGGEARR